ncbi:MAG: 5'-methylthioadenosine/S-adenosylhomocysteine nucleosidase [Cyanobacteria bacterium SZAS LIN-2]|nr:5'-methylthioadenosine/S-adenosylhomocysteine nucleosidase [Cyanobacteria bacterium SZAS LIN-2]
MTENKLAHVGIVIPTSFELAPFFEIWPQLETISEIPWQIYRTTIGALTVDIIVSYIGPANAAAATERLITREESPQIILHGGAAGAINSALLPGDIILGRSIKTVCSREILAVRQSLLLSASAIRYLKDGRPVHIDNLPGDAHLLQLATTVARDVCKKCPPWDGPGWPKSVSKRPSQATCGTLGSQDGWTKSVDELAFLATTFGVDSEDMESAYVAQIAAKHDIPCLAVRVVSNNEHTGTLAKDEILPAIGLAAQRAAMVICGLVDALT